MKNFKTAFVVLVFGVLMFTAISCGDSSNKEVIIKDMQPGTSGWIRAWHGGAVIDKAGKTWLEPEKTVSQPRRHYTEKVKISRLANGEYIVEFLPPGTLVPNREAEQILLPVAEVTTGLIPVRKLHRGIIGDMEHGEERWTNTRALRFDKAGFPWICLDSPAYPIFCCPNQIKISRNANGFQVWLRPEDEKSIWLGEPPKKEKNRWVPAIIQ